MVVEERYGALFHKPVFTHFYLKKQQLEPEQLDLLRTRFLFYGQLSEKQKVFFEHRLARFLERYTYVGEEGFVITNEVKVLVAATMVMLTFGMRKYLFPVFERIIVYPDIYFSPITASYHKGEFNPKNGAVVFSWKHFMEGYDISNDNLNLGIHEFTHVIHYHSQLYEDASAIIFTRFYNRILTQLRQPENRNKIIQSNYLRIYAYTNEFEFLSVLMEHYFETPDHFKAEFPELYNQVSKMLNHNSWLPKHGV